LIKGIKLTKQGTVIEFHDAMAALALIGRHHKLFTDNLDVSGTILIKMDV
jgi:hypothetical protein